MPEASEPTRYDAIVLGGGSAGIVCGVALGGLGFRTLLIEKDRLGGECLNTGCVPSKALLAAAKAAHQRRHAKRFGLPSAPISRDDARGVLAHVRSMIGTVRDADASESLLRDRGVDIRFGSPRFTGPDALSLDGDRLTARAFVLCTGSRPRPPAIPGLDRVIVLTNREIFGLNEIPPSLLVVGGGPVGVEMAQAFARLGSRVSLVQNHPRLLPQEDPEMTAELADRLAEDGVTLYLESQVLRFDGGEEEGAVATVRTREREVRIPCRHVLLGIGREPNVEGLNLDAAGVRVGPEGVEVDASLHTTGARVWACGDVTGKPQYSHLAEYEAKRVALNLLLPIRTRARSRGVPRCTFTDPELAAVGWTEAEARARRVQFLTLRQPFGQDDRALVEGEAVGWVKILVDPGLSGKILGAQILGPRAGELIQELTLAMEQGLGIRAVADSIHVYPTLAMAVQHAAQRWYETVERDPRVRGALRAYHAARPRLPVFTAAAAAAGLAGVGLLLLRRGECGSAEPDRPTAADDLADD